MYYLSTGPIMWVTPLSAFTATPVPPTAMYYTVPSYYVPPEVAVAANGYGVPVDYLPPVSYAPAVPAGPAYYSYPVPASSPRGEYRLGGCLMVC